MAATEEMNKVIALYDGYKEDEIQCEDWCGCNVLIENTYTGDREWVSADYHDNWSWLMPVWDKLRDELEKTHKGDAKLHNSLIGAALYQSELERAHRLIYEAIVWLNQNKGL